jgi:hypothetical protein
MKKIGIMNTPVDFIQEGPGKNKSKKVKNTGLSVYGGGIEKTPTGMSNAFVESGLSEDDLIEYANKYNFPTTSNKEFQQAQLNYLQSTPEGQNIIKNMMQKYGMPKAGTLADNILGARTFEIMKSIKEVDKQKTKAPSPPPPSEEWIREGGYDNPTFWVPGGEVLGYRGAEPRNPDTFGGVYSKRTGKIAPVRKEDYKKFALGGYAASYLERLMQEKPELFDFDTYVDNYGDIYRRKKGQEEGKKEIIKSKFNPKTGESTVIKDY